MGRHHRYLDGTEAVTDASKYQGGKLPPYHPQTQGKLGRFHRRLKAEMLRGKWFADSSEPSITGGRSITSNGPI